MGRRNGRRRSPGPAPGRPERPPAPLTSGSRKPQSRAAAAAAAGSGRCGPIGLEGARWRRATTCWPTRGPAAALPSVAGRAGARGWACLWPQLLVRPPLPRRLPLPAPPRGRGNSGAGTWRLRPVCAASRVPGASARWRATGGGLGVALCRCRTRALPRAQVGERTFSRPSNS